MKRLITIALIISTLVVCAACQPTPEKSAVQTKKGDELEKALGQDAQSIVIDAPEHVQESYFAAINDVNIEIDADVSFPADAVMLSAYHVTPAYIDKGVITRLCTLWGEGKALYDPRTVFDKESVEEAIHSIESFMTDEHLTAICGDNEKLKEQQFDEYKKERDTLLKLYKTLPEKKPVTKESDMELKPQKYYMSEEMYKYKKDRLHGSDKKELTSDKPTEYKAVAQLDNGQYVCIHLRNSLNGDDTLYSYSRGEKLILKTYSEGGEISGGVETLKNLFNYGDGETELVPCTISEDEAKEKALDFMRDVWGDDTAFTIEACAIQEGVYGQRYYYVRLKRNMNELEISERPKIMDAVAPADDDEEDESKHLRKAYRNENIMLYLVDDGVREYYHSGAIQVDRTINEGVVLKSFSEILDIYKQQSAVTYDNIVEYTEDADNPDTLVPLYADSSKVKITHISLCMLKLADKELVRSYIVVPVWKFFGEQEFSSPYPIRNVAMYVNAIDGTIVHYEDCY